MNNGPDQWQSLHDGRLIAMIDVAASAGDHTLKYFRSDDLVVDAKSDASPVTIADREAEQLVRKLLAEKFPNDAVQGEEFAEQAGTSPYRWVVDPIDGTKSFVCGVPLYSTLLALEHEGKPLGGVISIPALGEMIVAATGQGSWYRCKDADWKRASVSGKSNIAEAVFVTSQVDTFDARGAAEAYKRIERSAWLTRSWGDGYGYLMVATGRADIMIDPQCNRWDVAAMLPILAEAGGRFTDWKGNPTTGGGDGVGTNGKLHATTLALLRDNPNGG
jgi:histidinol phosphatase-like enzyme (inositol monophosphatase family)